ncbi:MAG TPA: NAD(P)/FAD-dependent oxidoreductase [Rhodanobacteraceae bacterium]|jgi:flavin-dependent dehydrogenase
MPVESLPQDWDAIVVGAGIAGAMSALHLARDNLRVLLVEKSEWPREKVCGGCLNAAALHALADAGIQIADGRGYAGMHLACGLRRAQLPLPEGIAISRRQLDALLVEHAIATGAHFLPATRASLGDAAPSMRDVVLRRGRRTHTVSTQIVLDCGGLASKLLPQADWRIAPGARIGVGAGISDVPTWYRSDVVHMACAPHGYVGLVRAEDGIANVAAALDPAWCRTIGGPAQAIEAIFETCGFPAFKALRQARWRGTPQLTRRRRRLGAERVLVLGDAAGYVEPFTGEGMAWALADAAAIAPLARRAVADWNDNIVTHWSAQHARSVRTRQRVCRGVSLLLRHTRLLAAALPLIGSAPALVSPLSAWLNRDFHSAVMVDE